MLDASQKRVAIVLCAVGSMFLLLVAGDFHQHTIAVQELFGAANLLEGETAKPFPIYTTLMVFYFLAIVMIARVLDRTYTRIAARGAS